MTVKVAFKGQRLSKVALCPVPEDTILTTWGVPIGDFTVVTVNGTVTVPIGNHFYYIKKYSSYNQYRFMMNTGGISVSVPVSVGDLYTIAPSGTPTILVTNHGTFGVLSDRDAYDGDYG